MLRAQFVFSVDPTRKIRPVETGNQYIVHLLCTSAVYQYSSVYICSVLLCIHYLTNTGKGVCTFAQYSCVYICLGTKFRI